MLEWLVASSYAAFAINDVDFHTVEYYIHKSTKQSTV